MPRAVHLLGSRNYARFHQVHRLQDLHLLRHLQRLLHPLDLLLLPRVSRSYT